MNNKAHTNTNSSGRNAEEKTVAPILESTQHKELVKKINPTTSNGGYNGFIGAKHNSTDSLRKRTRATFSYGDPKRDCRRAAQSDCPLVSIQEQADEFQQNFEPHSTMTSNGVTQGLTTNGYTVNGNGVSTVSSPSQNTRHSPKIGTRKQPVHMVSVNGESETVRMQTTNQERGGSKHKQFKTISVSNDSISENSNGLYYKSTEVIGLTQSEQNIDQDQVTEKQNIKQQRRQPEISKSSNCYGSYSYVQSSLCTDIHNGPSVKVIDFRSDTCSLPTEGMRDAIYRAQVGDAVYGEDPSVLALEKKSAKLFQKEAACFVPSGTMSNLVAILVHCNKRGSEIITGSKSHILLLEQAGVAQFGGINIREIQNNPDGTFSLNELKSKIRDEDAHTPYTSLICVENTHNVLGGKVLPQQWVEELCAYAKSVNLPVHMDGARIFSASAKLKIPVCEITRNVDTVTFCISKNLGAPYGAVLLGSKEFINKARRVIKALGGGVRQIGFMAAAGLYALENMVERLSEDHYHVHMIANAIREMDNPYVKVQEPEDIHSNILIIRLSSPKVTPIEFVSMLSTIYDDEVDAVMIKSFAMDRENVRFVLCNNNSKSDVEDAIRKIRFVMNKIG